MSVFIMYENMYFVYTVRKIMLFFIIMYMKI